MFQVCGSRKLGKNNPQDESFPDITGEHLKLSEAEFCVSFQDTKLADDGAGLVPVPAALPSAFHLHLTAWSFLPYRFKPHHTETPVKMLKSLIPSVVKKLSQFT